MTPVPMPSRRFVILIPVFNEWTAVTMLLAEIDALPALELRDVSVILIDDGSIEPVPASFGTIRFARIDVVRVVRLRRNLGHQRAIAVGLAWMNQEIEFDAVLVMDGDGEDSPADIPRLLERFDELGGTEIVFAERTRRAEGALFRLFYHLYRGLHRVLTGVSVRVGNFSVLPAGAVDSLVVVSDLWNHYAASVFKARLPFVAVPTERRARLSGASKMNFTSLVVHGLSAISVFGDRVGVRGILFAIFFLGLTVATLAVVVTIRFATGLAIPGWASLSSGLLLLVALQLLMGVTVFSLVVLAGRDSSSFLPSRDHAYFIRRVTELGRG